MAHADLGQLFLCIGFALLFFLEISKAARPWKENDDDSSTESPQMSNDSAVPPTTESLLASDEKLFQVQFYWSGGGGWNENLADTESVEFDIITKQIQNRLGHFVFNNKPRVLAWYVSKLEKSVLGLNVSLNVRTTMNMSAERLENWLLRSADNMSMSDINIVGEEFYLPETSILPDSTGSFFVTLSVSDSLRTLTPTPAALTEQTVSPVSTTPQWSTTPFMTTTVSSSISPTLSDEFLTSSGALDEFVTEQAKDYSTPSVSTKRSVISTKPTIPADTVKFVVSMTVDSYNYTPAMADPESSVFKEVVAEIENDLFQALCVKKLPCVAVKVFKLAEGSVIVSYNVHMASSAKYKRSDVQNVVSDAAKSGELGNLKVRNVEVEENKKEEEKESSSSSSRVFIYVLCGVGAFLVIALIVVAVSKYRGCRKDSQVHGIPSNSGDPAR